MSKPAYLTGGEPARLIPVTADSKKEERATSILLAALMSVDEFRKQMLGSLKLRTGSRTHLHAWTEINLDEGKKKAGSKKNNDRPDGLLVVNTGQKKWHALVEAKIGNAELNEDQLTHYLKRARDHKIDALITLSNQFVALPTHHPVKVSKTLLRGVDLFHWSWMYVVTQASLLLQDDAIKSDEQRFILEEVLRYFNHESSGITTFDRMNPEWKEVVGKVQSSAPLKKSAEEVENTVSHWHQEQRDLCLLMSRRLGTQVNTKLPRAHQKDAARRLKDDCETLVKDRILTCTLDIPDAAADLEITANLLKRTIRCGMKIDAPGDKKSTKARVNWLTRQLKNTETNGMYIKATRPGRAPETQAPLAEVMADPEVLDSDGTDVVATAFEVFYMLDLANRFAGNQVFISELEQAVPHFYEQAGERLRSWVAPPPKIKAKDPVERKDDTSGTT